jgi:hypothetical protein
VTKPAVYRLTNGKWRARVRGHSITRPTQAEAWVALRGMTRFMSQAERDLAASNVDDATFEYLWTDPTRKTK